MRVTEAEKVALWAVGPNTGASSKFMAAWLLGDKSNKWKSHPHDDCDFARCIGLLNAVPSFRTRIGEMASASPYWAALVKNWAKIEAMPDSDRYAFMRSILVPITDKDPKVFRMGKDVTIQFS